MCCVSCIDKIDNTNEKKELSYTEQTVIEFNKLKKPVILIGKSESWGIYDITVKDGNDSVKWFGNMSGLANSLGESHNVGDTLK